MSTIEQDAADVAALEREIQQAPQPEPAQPQPQPIPPQPETPPPAAAPLVEPVEPQPAQPAPMVPLPALHEEREKRKALQRQVEEQASRYATLEGRVQMLAQLQPQTPQQPTVPEQPTVSFDENPAENIRQQNEIMARQLSRLQEQNQKSAEEQRQQSERAQFTQGVQGDFRAYAADNPDFVPAYTHLRNQRIQQYRAMGMPDYQVEGAVQNEEIQLAATAIQSGKRPAEAFMAAAQASGWAKPNGNGAQPPPQPAQQATTADLLAQMEQPPVAAQQAPGAAIQAGMEAGSGLSAAVGGGTGRGITLEALADMSDADFERHYETAQKIIKQQMK